MSSSGPELGHNCHTCLREACSGAHPTLACIQGEHAAWGLLSGVALRPMHAFVNLCGSPASPCHAMHSAGSNPFATSSSDPFASAGSNPFASSGDPFASAGSAFAPATPIGDPWDLTGGWMAGMKGGELGPASDRLPALEGQDPLAWDLQRLPLQQCCSLATPISGQGTARIET